MTRKELVALICKKKSFLCVGLDSEMSKIPVHLLASADPVFEFNKQIIDATIDLAVAYKPNLAFYESRGLKGLESLHRTMNYLQQYKNEVFTIADAKRGDIGNTSSQYAQAFFDEQHSGLNFDAVTVAPYMGEDSVKPFLAFEGKWAILLALTSNKGSDDFQLFANENSTRLFEQVLHKSQQWGSPENTMYVIGATKAEMLGKIREIVPNHFLLVPGVGAQGGSLSDVAAFGLNSDCGILVNASRSIIFASKDENFATAARLEAKKMQEEMAMLLHKKGLI